MSDDVQTGTLIPYLTEMFRIQAWMAMGKVASPVSGKVERDLNVARQMIDLLAELETRTEGNRSEDETKMLQGVLTELRMNFMEEAKKPAETEAAASKEESEEDEEAAEETDKESDESEKESKETEPS
jgi:uncharacterized membrane protein YukC